MEERDNNRIDEAYFNTICEKLPFLRRLREEQEPMGNNYFALLIHFFKKFSELERELHLDKNPALRYELLFNIVEMGNLIKAMRLIERCDELAKDARNEDERDDIQICGKFLLTLNQYRNVVADGYHAYSTKTSSDIIPFFRNFFTVLGSPEPPQRFSQKRKIFRDSMFDIKKEFKAVNTPEDIYTFISSGGNKEEEKVKIITLLEGIKYFLDKAGALYRDNKKDCASLYFIAAANCARDLENYFMVKSIRTKGLTEATPYANIKLHEKDPRARHIATLLFNLKTLRQDRGQQFAHQYGKHKEVTAAAQKKKLSHDPEAKRYTKNIYEAIDMFLQTEYRIRSTMAGHRGSTKLTDDSPRGYKLSASPPLRNVVTPAQRHLIFEEHRPQSSQQGQKRERPATSELPKDRPGSNKKR